MPDSDRELFRALYVSAERTLKPKQRRRWLVEAATILRDITPENGIGPIVSSRRSVIQVLECALRMMDRSGA